MSIGDYFKPDWKHSNIEIRLTALDRLNVKSKKDFNTIQRIALEDTDPLVKEKAITLLNDPKIVQDLFQKTERATQKELFQLILEKIILKKTKDDLTAFNEEEMVPWLNIFNNQEHLKNLFLKTKNNDLKKYLIGRINEFEWIIFIFLNKKEKLVKDVLAKLKDKLHAFPEFVCLDQMFDILQECKDIYTELFQLKNNPNSTKPIPYPLYKKKIKHIKQVWEENNDKLDSYKINILVQNYEKIMDKIKTLLQN